MAATLSDLANGVSVTSNTTVVTGGTVTASVGDWLIVIAASSNDGANGDPSITTCVDSDGVNTYTRQALINYDPGALGAGATLAIFTCRVTNALSGDTITVNHSGNTTEKAVQVYKAVPGAGEYIRVIAVDTTGVTGNATSHTAAQVSVTSGDIIIGAAAIETDDAVTGDGDTTNGNWSAIVTRLADNGTDASTMSSSSQFKTTTGTGNQDWACSTATARDSARTYLILRSGILDATLASTLGTLTSSAVVTVGITATAAKTLGTLSASAAAGVEVGATLAKTLGAVTISATATVEDSGTDATLAKTLAAVTVSASASVDIGADLAKALAAVTSSANATVDVDASLAKTLGAVTASAAASVDATASLAATLGTVTASAVATVADDATTARTLGSVTASAAASVDVTATLAQTLGAVLLSGTVSGETLTEADLAKTLDALTASGAATVDIQATLARTLASVTLAASGSVDVDASLAKTLGLLAASAAASVDIGATLGKTLADCTLAGTITDGGTDDGDCRADITLGALTCSGSVALRRAWATVRRPGFATETFPRGNAQTALLPRTNRQNSGTTR